VPAREAVAVAAGAGEADDVFAIFGARRWGDGWPAGFYFGPILGRDDSGNWPATMSNPTQRPKLRLGQVVFPYSSFTFSFFFSSFCPPFIAYVKSLPPADSNLPETQLGPLGRVLMVAGQLPLVIAPQIDPK